MWRGGGGRGGSKRGGWGGAGRQGGHSWGTLRKGHVAGLRAEIAGELLRLERLQRAWNAMERREQVSSELALDWLRRFDAYSAMAFAANAMANHLASALDLGKADSDEQADGESRDDLLRSALHEWTRFSRVERRYIMYYSGIWMISSRENLATVVAAVEVLDRDVPFTYRDASWLRLRLLDEREYEVDGFIA